MIKYLLKDIHSGNYLSETANMNKMPVSDTEPKYAFRPYDVFKVCRFDSKEKAIETCQIYKKHSNRPEDIVILEVVGAEF